MTIECKEKVQAEKLQNLENSQPNAERKKTQPLMITTLAHAYTITTIATPNIVVCEQVQHFCAE